MNKLVFMALLVSSCFVSNSFGWTPTPVDVDPLVRMPGTQPGLNAAIVPPAEGSNDNSCVNCHWGDPDAPEEQGIPGFFWQGSMMAQAARDPIFWTTMTVAAQDSIWVIGRPNATDICLRCHFPEGWLNGRSDDVSGGEMTGSDYDGVHCDVCHKLYDPFFTATANGTRGESGAAYWDEDPNSINILTRLTQTESADWSLASILDYFNDDPLFNNSNKLPMSPAYTENAGGQMFVDTSIATPQARRGPFADAAVDTENHTLLYSRYHKSKYFCSTCHDVSNPVLANLGADSQQPLPSELNSAFSYSHVERTFSEFMSSAYGQTDGAATNQEFQDQGNASITHAASCQDCHLPDVNGVTAASGDGVVRPQDSLDHPTSGVPMHDLQGGNMWITYILASTDDSLGIFDQTNKDLLNQGPATLTLDMTQGISPMIDSNGEALEASSARAKAQLLRAATIKSLVYDPDTGALSFRILNNTGHKLLTGYPEGRRLFVNIKAYQGGSLIYEVNPYDALAGTLKGGLSFWSYDGDDGNLAIPDPEALGAGEVHDDDLIYEATTKSDLTGEDHTFHFALATDLYKDNRIPPKGFDLAIAETRLALPVASGGIKDDPATPGTNLYSTTELAEGADDVSMTIIDGADRVAVTLYYQGTSREYIEFLRDEINGTGANRALYGPDAATGSSVPTFAQANDMNPDSDNAYLAGTDIFFDKLRAWGNTMWQLWYHNHGLDGTGPAVPGIVPFAMAEAQTGSVVTPNGGESLAGMSTVNIQWTDFPDAATYWVRFSSDGGTSWSRLATQDAALPTNYSWSIPNNINSANCLVNVIAFNGAGQWLATDSSDGVFTVAPVP